jgi:hypothetical protein
MKIICEGFRHVASRTKMAPNAIVISEKPKGPQKNFPKE